MNNSALTPLTLEEAEFAAQQYRLIFSYLDKNALDERDFFDVAVIGFLMAVRRYLSTPKLQHYAFSTIAWRSMKSSVNQELRSRDAQKRDAQTVSLDASTIEVEELNTKTWRSTQNDVLLAFETELLLHDLSQRVTKKQMDVIHLRMAGYSMRLIAKAKKMTVRDVSTMLGELFEVVMDVCYGTSI